MERIDRRNINYIRYAVQWGIFALTVYAGYRFYLFTEHFRSGGPLVERPPMVEAFLPIGALMSLKLWVYSLFSDPANAIFDPVHPAGLTIFTAALLMSLLLRKSFCGWICPVGTVSEPLFRLGRLVFRRDFKIHPYLDIPLRSLKYLLLIIFVFLIIFQMSSWMILAFMIQPYWKVADVKMLQFFTNMSPLTMYVLIGLVVLGVVFKNFWCRYLCPYGALTGLLGALGPTRITRDDEACIHCHKCDRACPYDLPVEGKAAIKSPECNGCLACVASCPAKGALDVALPSKTPVRPMLFATLVVILFFGLIWTAKLTGHWETAITYQEYQTLIPQAQNLPHP